MSLDWTDQAARSTLDTMNVFNISDYILSTPEPDWLAGEAGSTNDMLHIPFSSGHEVVISLDPGHLCSGTVSRHLIPILRAVDDYDWRFIFLGERNVVLV